MDLTGTYPKLTDADSVYAIKEYSERLATALGGQIKKIAAKVGVPNNTLNIVGGQKKIIPYMVQPAVATDYATGVSVQPNGQLTINATGIYSATFNLGASGTINGAGLKVIARLNGVELNGSEVTMGATAWLNTMVHYDALPLNAGDVLDAVATLTGTGGSLYAETSTTYATLAWEGVK